ncbi:hypothetical protein NPX13_g11360 [Xylaria arbuscula]|uniref:t-SNARE coiled-coil homology domain-containing protein n=1 Tax=Xylaria arbuscula TaxID=114810 RepID=A0A9W8TGK6_9PEZI|nr:hypothetical protein NPX13_g11360 [Xylaria arbuscula]
MASANQLFLLADHIKLSLLERQRAQSLDISGDSNDGHISRSLDQFKDGLAALENELKRLQEAGNEELSARLAEAIRRPDRAVPRLLFSLDHRHPDTRERPLSRPGLRTRDPETVRRLELQPPTQEWRPHGVQDGALLGQPGEPGREPGPRGAAVRGSVPRQPGRHHGLPRRGERHEQRADPRVPPARPRAAGRAARPPRREHSAPARADACRSGDELDDQVAMLDDVDVAVDRHQGRLDRAKRQVNRITRAAGESKQMIAIIVLIIILVLLIAILK